ncbi:TIGR02611 family protein [Corynebacterium alimapuense]
MVSERVERFAATHSRSKNSRYGFLVRPLTLTLGWVVLIIGLITIPLPGQGWLTTFIGVGILSLEQVWAHKLLRRGVHIYDLIVAWFHRQTRSTRILLSGLLIALVWLVFTGMIYGAWRSGTLDFLTPFATWIGLER